MAQPGVAREPSMEEILASIRRIIESNEPGAENGLSDTLPFAGEEDGSAAEPSGPEAGHPVVADSAGMPLRAANSSFTPPRQEAAPPADKPQSLADIAARVRNMPAREAVPPVAARPAPPVLPAATAPFREEPPVFAEPQVRTQGPLPPQPLPEPAGGLRPGAPLAGAAFETAPPADAQAAFEPAAGHDDSVSQAAPPVAASAVAEISPSTALAAPEAEDFQPLLSQEAGAMVARSFGALAEAVDGAERRSLDEIAEELLRPMLREWLDDNLPTLVERLVREEIERVARGPKR